MEIECLVQEPENIHQKTPMLLLLHGYGSNEEDLFAFRETLPQNWLLVSFRAPHELPFGGYAWFDINFNSAENKIDDVQAFESLNYIMKSIENLKIKYSLNENPVYLCGFSQGGMLNYALALSYPQYFSKVACLSAYPEPKLLTKIKSKKEFSNLRFFISHGTEDVVIPLKWARRGADLLYDLDIKFSFREYMSGHGVNQKNYRDLMDFLINENFPYDL